MNKISIKNLTNIDVKEIQKFDALSLQWWNINGIFRSLHYINTIRLHYILTHCNNLFKKKILDIGCGGGLLAESMARSGAEVVGLDMSSKSLKIAKSHALSQNLTIKYILETIEEHACHHTSYYDIITCMEFLEHIPDPKSTIHACANAIKPGGSVFFSTLNRTLKSWMLAIIGAEYLFCIVPKGTHNFKKFITPDELINWLDTTTLEAHNITGIYYNPCTTTCSLTKDISINYILHTQRQK